jgi:hypothetical protein
MCKCSLTRLPQKQQQTHLNFTFSFPQTDAKAFQNVTTSQQYQFIADFTAAAITHERAVMGATHDDKARAWGRQEKYCQSIRCSNFYMDGLRKQEKILMLGAFAMTSDLDNSQGIAMGHWLREQSGVPSHM